MCTLSIIQPSPGAFRIVMNRDEERTRAEAIAPEWHDLPSHGGLAAGRAIYPLDPQSGGTWIAATTGGLVLAIMNGNPEPRPPAPRTLGPARTLSRGTIIPALLRMTADPLVMLQQLRGFGLERFPPFRLVALSRAGPKLVTFTWNGKVAFEELLNAAKPRAFASSGLGDALVQCRLPLFEETVGARPTAAAQDEFHRHMWPESRHLSVLMSREDARTVSITTVEMDGEGTRMNVAPVEA